MTLREYASKQNSTPAPEEQTPKRENAPIATAQKLIAEHKRNREVAESCRLQIMQDIERKENPYKILLTAAEAISRLSNAGDTFYLQVQQKLLEVHGTDIAAKATDPDTGNIIE